MRASRYNRPNDYIGRRYNRLVVVRQEGQYKGGRKLYVCQCDCGGEVRTPVGHLTSGAVRSCGCWQRETRHQPKAKRRIPIGTVVGRLTVVEASERRSKNGTIYYTCICECGNTTNAASHSLSRGSTRSCGCLSSELVSARNAARTRPGLWRTEWFHGKSVAQNRGLAWELSQKEFETLIDGSACHYCGCAPKNQPHTRAPKLAKKLRMGIDRVDSDSGYAASNCVPCCRDCNLAKGSLSYTEFLSSIRRRYLHVFDPDNAI